MIDCVTGRVLTSDSSVNSLPIAMDAVNASEADGNESDSSLNDQPDAKACGG